MDIEKIIQNKNEAIGKLNEYLDNNIIKDEKHRKKANLISYWVKDYIKYIEQEETFSPNNLKQYSRGDIIKVNLGFNIGNEEGGLHYCVIIDKKNAKSYSTLTVIPLTSLKNTSKERKTSVFLGNEIYINLLNKSKKLLSQAEEESNELEKELNSIKKIPQNTEEEKIILEYKINNIKQKINENKNRVELINKINSELSQMKAGTIALINQITTISKQRIYNPKKDFDILSGIRLSDENMKLIDEKIKKFFIKY